MNLLSDLGGSGLTAGANVLVADDPRIAPLGDHSDPTQTMPPLPGSPTIEGAPDAVALITDQTGNPRPSWALPDIDAVEALSLSNLALFDSDDYFRITSFTPAEDFDSKTNSVFDITFSRFPSLGNAFECAQYLDLTTLGEIPHGTVTDFTTTTTIQLLPGQDFVRAKRN
ncbi:MAG: choice-of-anchor Q domain-containing protein [Opitutaceae bacterium]